MDKLSYYVSIVPSERQLAIQRMGFYAFIHYGLNTYEDKEWGDGTAKPAVFQPTSLDTDQWARSIAEAGMKGVIFTAKHHDGFCLWQTATTEYSIKNSSYKGGKGDIVRELQASCKKYGIKLGLYLSPWDRNSEYYGTDRYNDYYIEQLTELLKGYPELFAIWLDAACGAWMDGKAKQVYDFKRICATIREYQPDCIISNSGPDVRWLGNEGARVRKSEFNVVTEELLPAPLREGIPEVKDSTLIMKEDIGSREILADYDRLIWYPAEADMSIRPGWFYHKAQDSFVKSADKLMRIYYDTVGSNCLFLLNLPPDKRGVINEVDEAVLKELGNRIRSAFKNKVEVLGYEAPQAKQGFERPEPELDKSYSPIKQEENYLIRLTFSSAFLIDKLVMKEDTRYSQRIESFIITTEREGKKKILYKGTTVGFNKIALFKPTLTDNISIEITECRMEPYILELSPYLFDGYQPPREMFYRIKTRLRRAFEIAYSRRQEKKNKM